MLVLSRKAGESIRIGDDLVVTVTRVRGNRVQISIDAPREVAIRRGELAPLDDVPAAAVPARRGLPVGGQRCSDAASPLLLSVPMASQTTAISRSA